MRHSLWIRPEQSDHGQYGFREHNPPWKNNRVREAHPTRLDGVYFESATMKDFVSIDIDSTLSNDDVFVILSGAFPEFKWRRGDSDTQGTYVTGMGPDKVEIQCWTGESPMSMSISFRSAKNYADEAKEWTVNVIMLQVLPSIGRLVKRIDNA